jgi:hypothetical protein
MTNCASCKIVEEVVEEEKRPSGMSQIWKVFAEDKA